MNLFIMPIIQTGQEFYFTNKTKKRKWVIGAFRKLKSPSPLSTEPLPPLDLDKYSQRSNQSETRREDDEEILVKDSRRKW